MIAPATLTREQLEQIRIRVVNTPIYRDKYGGEYVMYQDGRKYGQHAIMDRKRLIEHIDALQMKLTAAGLSVPC
jgi:hypothetical protein